MIHLTKLANLTDEQVVSVARSRDKEMYVELIARYQTRLFRYALYLLNDDHKAADVVQESFVKAYINLHGFDVKKKFSSWIYRIVHNQAMNVIDKNKKQLPMDETIDFDSGVDLEDDVIKHEMTHQAHNCLEKIPLIFREPLSLYFLEDKSYEEICDILHIPVNTVGSRISRAKKMMRNICQKK